MKKVLLPAFCYVKAKVSYVGRKAKLLMIAAIATFLSPVTSAAQSLAGTGYDAGTNALEEVASELVKYVPYVVNLCYALAGIVAIVGAISVYISMNNEEQDVKNILVLENGSTMRRKEMKVNTLNINALYENLYFPMLARMTIKKT